VRVAVAVGVAVMVGVRVMVGVAVGVQVGGRVGRWPGTLVAKRGVGAEVWVGPGAPVQAKSKRAALMKTAARYNRSLCTLA
jgi:hypothetical protein